jgi:hypothetical protein
MEEEGVEGMIRRGEGVPMSLANHSTVLLFSKSVAGLRN